MTNQQPAETIQQPAETMPATVDAETGEIIDGAAPRWTVAALAALDPTQLADELFKLDLSPDTLDVRVLTGSLDISTKDALEGRPFIVLDYRHNDSDQNPRGFWSIVIGTWEPYGPSGTDTPSAALAVFNDGGVGIPPVLEEAERRGHVALRCPKGLRKSSYGATDKRPAGTTYYFA